ncbi:helix-turn-helix transcriptional regulator [Streptomyces sp. TRM43335]|uniref:Helix-turn-helix transcriptional regulator n=1 Tax=Streptomyces taklimakanensis TaxID=2569853 RepID=A0A6G2BB31_9ACTN|nr:helix-turn-helix transcriptional regulator [Streptomyces taklimakanensis]MTE19481.1 helix-turn-helix transcriptional regulator [Streptomyces taklimakanensis]
MLAHPGAGVLEFVHILGWSEEEIRAALDELADLSLLHLHTDGGALRVVSPRVALETLIARQQARVAEQQLALAESHAAAEAFIAHYSELLPRRPSGTAESIIGLQAVRQRIAELGEQAEKEVLCFSPGGGQSPASIEAAKPLTQEQLSRGVRVRTVYLDSVRNDAATYEYARWETEQGGETRTVPALPLRMHIVDREAALVPLDPEDTSKGAALIREPGAVAAFRALFEAVWEGAQPFGEPVRRGLDDPGSQLRELLRLLAQGYTDEAAARRLGVSLRTERRLITELMERLDAQSRFQLGQRAMEHGLL